MDKFSYQLKKLILNYALSDRQILVIEKFREGRMQEIVRHTTEPFRASSIRQYVRSRRPDLLTDFNADDIESLEKYYRLSIGNGILTKKKRKKGKRKSLISIDDNIDVDNLLICEDISHLGISKIKHIGSLFQYLLHNKIKVYQSSQLATLDVIELENILINLAKILATKRIKIAKSKSLTCCLVCIKCYICGICIDNDMHRSCYIGLVGLDCKEVCRLCSWICYYNHG